MHLVGVDNHYAILCNRPLSTLHTHTALWKTHVIKVLKWLAAGCHVTSDGICHMRLHRSSTIVTWVIAIANRSRKSEVAAQQWRQTLQLWLSWCSKDEGQIHWQSVTTDKQAVAKITHIFQWCAFHKYRASCNIWLEIYHENSSDSYTDHVTRAALHTLSITYDKVRISDVVRTYYLGGTNTTVKALLVKNRECSGHIACM